VSALSFFTLVAAELTFSLLLTVTSMEFLPSSEPAADPLSRVLARCRREFRFVVVVSPLLTFLSFSSAAAS